VLIGPALLIWGIHYLFTRQTPEVQPQPGDFHLPAPLTDDLWRQPGAIAGLCALVAFLTSALVELLKIHFRIRATVHYGSMVKWLKGRLSSVEESQKNFETTSDGNPVDVNPARKQIEDLCAAGEPGKTVFYDLPTKQFCGQIATAIDLIMLTPAEYPNLYSALTSGTRDQKTTANHFAELASKGYDTLEPSEKDKYDQLRARIGNYAQRALDGLQLEATQRWKRQVLFASMQVSLGISLATVMIVAPPSKSGWLMFCYSTAVGGLAGTLLAPLAYDITAAIRRFGRQ
jgi:hypothetical protein